MPRSRTQDPSQHARPTFSCTVVRSTEAFDADGWVSRYVAHVIALYQAIERKEAA